MPTDEARHMRLLDEECRAPDHDIADEDALNSIKGFFRIGDLVGKAKECVRIIKLLLVSDAHVTKTGFQAFEFAAMALSFLRHQDVDGKSKTPLKKIVPKSFGHAANASTACWQS